MANYTASALSAAQVAFAKKFNDPELRRKQNPALNLGIKNQNILVHDVQGLKSSETRPVKAYLKTQRAASNQTAKSHNHTGGKSDSRELTLVWVQFVEPFSILLKQAQGNILTYSEMLQHEITQSVQNIHDRVGSYSLAWLQSNRTQLAAVAKGTGGAGTWNATRFALEVAAGKKDYFFQNADSFMKRQNYNGRLDILADQPAFREAGRINAQGGGNATNLSFQLGRLNIVETTEDIDSNYANGAVLAMQEGSFACLPWNDPANLNGKGDYDSTLGGYGSILDPLGTGLKFDFHAYTERVDGTGQGGQKQDEALQGEVSLTAAFMLAPLTTANESVVWQIAQL